MLRYFGVRCPIGTCSKGSGLISKKLKRCEAKAAMIAHLVNSPYHELDATAAEHMAESAPYDEWEEEVRDAVMLCERQPLPVPPRRASESLIALAGARVSNRADDDIVLNRAQVQAMVDSLKRAKLAAETAGALAARASRAFGEEALVIGSCADALAAYLA